MHINITARHLNLTPAISDYVRKKLERNRLYSAEAIWVQVKLNVESKIRHVAEIIVHVRKNTFIAKEQSSDLYSAIDLAMDKLQKQLKKYKEITKTSKKSGSHIPQRAIKRNKENVLAFASKNTKKQLISEIKRFDIKPLSVPEAIDEMDSLDYDFYMFINEESTQVNVVFRRESGKYGLLEPKS